MENQKTHAWILPKRVIGFTEQFVRNNPEENRTSCHTMSTLIKRGILWLGVCLVLPMLGVWLAGWDLAPFLTFPPVVRDIGEIGFSVPVGWFYWLGMGALFTWLLWRRGNLSIQEGIGSSHKFPFWGWLGVLWTGIIWWLAWSRLDSFAWGQKYTFSPLWFGYIVVVNAWIQSRSGKCPMLEKPKLFLALFPVSAVFWWVFEYYNRFVQNWIYLNSDVSAVEYFVHATIAFSTVLPAVYSTAEALLTFPGLQRAMTGPKLKFKQGKGLALAVLGVCTVAFLLIGVFPRILYPLLWTGPFLIWLALSALAGDPEDFGRVEKGDWRKVWSWALAALICGFFWEMWNSHSLAKWIYQVPYLHGGLIFEMPLAGYLGYLPFGLECGVVTGLVARVLSGRR